MKFNYDNSFVEIKVLLPPHKNLLENNMYWDVMKRLKKFFNINDKDKIALSGYRYDEILNFEDAINVWNGKIEVLKQIHLFEIEEMYAFELKEDALSVRLFPNKELSYGFFGLIFEIIRVRKFLKNIV